MAKISVKNNATGQEYQLEEKDVQVLKDKNLIDRYTILGDKTPAELKVQPREMKSAKEKDK